MKKFICGLIVGLLLATSAVVLAEGQALRLVVNGEDITAQAEPIIINGRTLVPARALAESLGAKVEWDGSANSVIVTSNLVVSSVPTDLPQAAAQSVNDTTGWMSLVELGNNGVIFRTGINGSTLSKGDATIQINVPSMSNGEQITISGVRVWNISSRTYLNLEDLAKIGITL